MGKRGPAPKSTQQKKLEGNPGKRPLNTAEPEFDIGAEMSLEVKRDPIARAEWNTRAPELIRKGVLTRQDQTEFNEYCLQHSASVNLWRNIKRQGYETAIMKGIYKAWQSAVAMRGRLAAKFGFTPSDRSQVKIMPPAKPQGAGRFLTVVK